MINKCDNKINCIHLMQLNPIVLYANQYHNDMNITKLK